MAGFYRNEELGVGEGKQAHGLEKFRVGGRVSRAERGRDAWAL